MTETKGTRLQDKVAIVTGAGARGGATGTGYAISMLFAQQGAKVLLADMDVARAEATLADIEEAGGQASIFEIDVTKEDQCRAMIEATIARYGELHVLVNNVGVSGSGMVTEVEEAVWNRALDGNLKSMMLVSKYAVPKIAEAGGGSIINISSVDGLRAGFSRNIPYSVAKGGAVTLTKAMAVHHGRDGVRVNCIAPGHIHASFVTDLPDELRELRSKANPLGTEGTAWDIAWASVFLASDEARWISGVVLPIDAGMLAATPLSVREFLME